MPLTQQQATRLQGVINFAAQHTVVNSIEAYYRLESLVNCDFSSLPESSEESDFTIAKLAWHKQMVVSGGHRVDSLEFFMELIDKTIVSVKDEGISDNQISADPGLCVTEAVNIIDPRLRDFTLTMLSKSGASVEIDITELAEEDVKKYYSDRDREVEQAFKVVIDVVTKELACAWIWDKKALYSMLDEILDAMGAAKSGKSHSEVVDKLKAKHKLIDLKLACEQFDGKSNEKLHAAYSSHRNISGKKPVGIDQNVELAIRLLAPVKKYLELKKAHYRAKIYKPFTFLNYHSHYNIISEKLILVEKLEEQLRARQNISASQILQDALTAPGCKLTEKRNFFTFTTRTEKFFKAATATAMSIEANEAEEARSAGCSQPT